MGSYNKTMGTLLVGIFFNTFLYGLVTYQFAAYYQTKFNDPPTTKYMVLFLFVLDTFHSASAIYMAWDYLVTDYNDPAALAVAEWPFTFTPLGTALAAFVTQIYLGFRIRRLTGSKFLHGVVVLLAIPTLVLGMACCIEASIIQVWASLPRITPMAIAWVSLQVVVDVIITVSLVIAFCRSRTGFRNMDSLLNRLIRCAIQTGLFGSIFALADLIAFVTLPDTSIYAMLSIPIGRVYTNTLLDTLLTREMLMVERDEAGNMTRSIVIDSVCWPTCEMQATSTAQSSDIQKSCPEHAVDVQVTRQWRPEMTSGAHDLGPC